MSSNYTYAIGVLERKKLDAQRPLLGWDSKEQIEDWAFYLASGSTGYLMLIVFGTTRESRAQAQRLWASFRGRVRIERGGDNGCVPFHYEGNSAICNTEPRFITLRTNERRRTPKPMTFVNSGGLPLRSPDDRGNPSSLVSYNDIDLKTPRI